MSDDVGLGTYFISATSSESACLLITDVCWARNHALLSEEGPHPMALAQGPGTSARHRIPRT